MGVGAPETDFEVEAKRLLQALLGGNVVDRDVAGAQGARDFELVDGEVVAHAVEVTSVQLPTARATRREIERLRSADLGLTASWHLYLHEEARTKPIEHEAPSLLNMLYEQGVVEFDVYEPPTAPQLAAAVRRLAELQIPRG